MSFICECTFLNRLDFLLILHVNVCFTCIQLITYLVVSQYTLRKHIWSFTISDCHGWSPFSVSRVLYCLDYQLVWKAFVLNFQEQNKHIWKLCRCVNVFLQSNNDTGTHRGSTCWIWVVFCEQGCIYWKYRPRLSCEVHTGLSDTTLSAFMTFVVQRKYLLRKIKFIPKTSSLISLCGLHMLILDDSLSTCIIPLFTERGSYALHTGSNLSTLL